MNSLLRRLLISILILLIGGIAVYLYKSSLQRYPLSSEESVVHYCSCVQDNPQNQILVLNAAYTVNELITDRTLTFTNEHNLFPTDFNAAFIPLDNGNYSLKTWSSNRTSKIYNLYNNYTKLVEECLDPHHKALKQAHKSLLK